MNLDPANESLPYPCAIDVSSLITLHDVMDEHGLGPNGAMLYCMEYLEENYDWLEGRLNELGNDAYVVFDLPGQVEISTHHDSLKRILQKLTKAGFRVRARVDFANWINTHSDQLAAVHLCDAHYVTDASKYISVLLLSLRTMLHLELPHVNVLSKVDLITQYGDLGEVISVSLWSRRTRLKSVQTSILSSIPKYRICRISRIFYRRRLHDTPPSTWQSHR